LNPSPWEALLPQLPQDIGTRLDAYGEELRRWNRVIRLVGPREVSGIRVQIADALSPFLFYSPAFPLLDVGTGAGLPAIPIALSFPEARITCIEPLAKRVSFLRHVIRSLGLSGVEVVQARAEDALGLHPELLNAFATATARALGAPALVLEWVRPFLRPDGIALLPRGPERAHPYPGWELLADADHASPSGPGTRRLHVYRVAN